MTYFPWPPSAVLQGLERLEKELPAVSAALAAF
jgi:hypothetical protein